MKEAINKQNTVPSISAKLKENLELGFRLKRELLQKQSNEANGIRSLSYVPNIERATWRPVQDSRPSRAPTGRNDHFFLASKLTEDRYPAKSESRFTAHIERQDQDLKYSSAGQANVSDQLIINQMKAGLL